MRLCVATANSSSIFDEFARIHRFVYVVYYESIVRKAIATGKYRAIFYVEDDLYVVDIGKRDEVYRLWE